jgi:hypothetical protein
MWPNDFKIFADMLDIFPLAPFRDVKPASGTRVDLDAYDLSPRCRKQPFPCGLRIKPSIKDALRRRTELACDAGTEKLLGIHCAPYFSSMLVPSSPKEGDGTKPALVKCDSWALDARL